MFVFGVKYNPDIFFFKLFSYSFIKVYKEKKKAKCTF